MSFCSGWIEVEERGFSVISVCVADLDQYRAEKAQNGIRSRTAQLQGVDIYLVVQNFEPYA